MNASKPPRARLLALLEARGRRLVAAEYWDDAARTDKIAAACERSADTATAAVWLLPELRESIDEGAARALEFQRGASHLERSACEPSAAELPERVRDAWRWRAELRTLARRVQDIAAPAFELTPAEVGFRRLLASPKDFRLWATDVYARWASARSITLPGRVQS